MAGGPRGAYARGPCHVSTSQAAARLPLLGLTGLRDCLDERLSVLIAGARDAPARQQTLRATLEWSHSLLDPW